MKIVLFAYHDIGCEGLKTLRAMGHEISAVFTQEDDPGENIWFGSVKKLANRMNLKVFVDEDLDDPAWIPKIKAIKPDLIFSFYYRKMIRECLLAIPPKGALNLHGSLLPRYRGRAPVNWVLVNGESETGLTLHHMVKKPDAGDIVAQRRVAIADEDTALTLYRKMVPLVGDILKEAVPLLEKGTAPRIVQDAAQATYFGGRKPADGKIDWTKPAKTVYNLIRAVTHPYPGAFAERDGKKVLVWWGKPESGMAEKKPGAILSTSPLTIACGEGALRIEKIQTEGGPELNGADWAAQNGVKIGTIWAT